VAWIKLRNNLDDDPRVLRLQEELKIADVDLLVGKLWRLWKHADEHSEDGFLPWATKTTIDNLVRLPGFAAAMEKVEWLRFDEHGAHVPEFDKHNSQSAKKRANNAAAMAAKRQATTKPAPTQPQTQTRLKTRAKNAPTECTQEVHTKSTNGTHKEHNKPRKLHLEKEKEKEKEKEGEGGAPPSQTSREDNLPITESADLADEFAFNQVGTFRGARKDDPRDTEPEIAEMLRLGLVAEKLREAIHDKNRDRSERWWQLKKRLWDDPRKSSNGSATEYQPKAENWLVALAKTLEKK